MPTVLHVGVPGWINRVLPVLLHQTAKRNPTSTTKKPTQMLERAPKGLFSTQLAFELPVDITVLVGEQVMATPSVQCSP